MKKILLIELYPFKPHLETSCEIALNEKEKGNEVYFLWLGDLLKWSEVRLNVFQRLLLCSYEKKIKNLQNLLIENDIQTLDFNDFSKIDRNKIKNWSLKFNGSIKRLSVYKYNNKNLGIGVVSSLISYFHNSKFEIHKHKKVVKKCLESSAIVYDISKNVLKKLKPDKVVTFNSRFFATNSIILASKELNIKVDRHERGSNFKKYEIFEHDIHNYRYRSNKILEYWHKSKDKNKQKIAKSYFLKKKKGKSLGRDLGLQFTNYQDQKFKWSSKKKKVVYFTSTTYEHEAISHEIGKNYWKNQIEIINDLWRLSHELNLEFIVRMHPKPFKLKSKSDEDEIIKFCDKKKIQVIKPKEKINSYHLIQNSDYVVHYGSNIGIEATYWKKISISLRKSYYYNHNVVFQPRNFSELKQLFLKNLKAKPSLNCLPHGYYFLTFGKKYKYFKPDNYYDISYKNNYYNFESKIYLFLKSIYKLLKSN